MKDEANPKSVFVQLRRQHNLTQRQVADALETQEQTIRNWEQGRHTPRLTIPQVKKLCTLFNCTIHDLPDFFGPIEDGDKN